MELTWNGHACLTLRSTEGRTLVMDPYLSGAFGGRIAHAPLRCQADVVSVSHYHVDHAHVTGDLGSPVVVDCSCEVAGVSFQVRPTYHDRHGGCQMGMTAMTSFTWDGLRVAHLGDIGCDLTPEDVDALGPIDILIWPTGGVYTLGPGDARHVLEVLAPRVAIPVHYDNARCDLGMATVDALYGQTPYPIVRPGTSTWESTQGLSESPRVVVLEPAL